MIRESPSQTSRREFLAGFFATATLRESSAGKPAPVPSPRPTTGPKQSSKTINQARGKDGKLIFQDCDGAETGRIEWKKGLIVTEGEQTIQAGCSDGTSSS